TPQYFFESRLHYLTKHHGRAYAALSTVAALTGGAIWRLRRLVGNKPQLDPDRHWLDLAGHSLRTALHPRQRAPRKLHSRKLSSMTEDGR
ncbi:glycosyltransferase family 2 protein, partial [Cribrihabitans sp. XS_ASV171]